MRRRVDGIYAPELLLKEDLACCGLVYCFLFKQTGHFSDNPRQLENRQTRHH